jgi:hypothetical protein
VNLKPLQVKVIFKTKDDVAELYQLNTWQILSGSGFFFSYSRFLLSQQNHLITIGHDFILQKKESRFWRGSSPYESFHFLEVTSIPPRQRIVDVRGY